MGICTLVRESCQAVAEAAELVRIDGAMLDRYATMLAGEHFGGSTESPGSGQDPEQVAARVLAVNAINFGSGFHDIVDKEPGMSGSRTMATRWSRYVDERGVDVDRLRSLTTGHCVSIFGQRPDHPEQVELMTLFATALRQLGEFVAERFDGSFLAVVRHADGSAEALAESLLAMPLYVDRLPLGDEVVHFYKRAQITAADLARALSHIPAARFDDLDRLTAFADNLLPHVLMVDGVIGYDPALAADIANGRLLRPCSRAEIEIRATAVEVVERLTQAVTDRGVAVRAMDVDLWLWTRGSGARYKGRPRHRTRCTFY